MATTTVCCSCLIIRSDGASSSAGEPLNNNFKTAQPQIPTKVLLPNKKPQKWSTGVAPGEYGGPPISSDLRRYWGGNGDEDPVTDMDDFIWNKDFVPKMQRFIRQDQKEQPPLISFKEPESGFLSLNRAMNLDSVDIDLSAELLASAPKPLLEQQVEAARHGHSIANERLSHAASPKWRLAPTRREQDKWDRAGKATTGGTNVLLRETTRNRGDPKVLAAQARDQYFKLKKKLQLLTLGIGSVGIISAYVSYSLATAASFSIGVFGSLMYIRMLGNSVDFSDGVKGAVRGAAAQPRLLVPVALVMIYNRWNAIGVPDYGLMHLDLIPMLVGFFTYKIATFAQAIEDSFILIDPEVKNEN
ncbi:ATP synthase protein I [Zostera marina]|uniref:ATP synthase protein I n=1 Tax=Zostera marina TaxID=29655 RepID=A0A0K9NK75_ZOSMR|nr:ATP synthase protein I [Zostera marina]